METLVATLSLRVLLSFATAIPRELDRIIPTAQTGRRASPYGAQHLPELGLIIDTILKEFQN